MTKFYLFKSFMLVCMLTIFGIGSAWAQYVKTDIANLQTGDIVVIVDEIQPYAVSNAVSSSSQPTAVKVTINEDNIALEDNNIEWIFTKNDDGTYTFESNANKGNYLEFKTTGTDNKGVRVQAATTNYTSNLGFKAASKDNKNRLWTKVGSDDRFLSLYTTQDWRSYKATAVTGGENIFYKKEVSGKTPAGIAYETKEYTVNIGKIFETPVLTNPNTLTPTYESSNPEVATVNSTTGAVKIIGEGTTTITATTAETDTYYKGMASYTITVVDPSKVFTLVTEANSLKAGDQIIIVGYKNSTSKYYAMGAINGTYYNQTADEVSVSEDLSTLVPAADATILKVEQNGENLYLNDAANGYIYISGDRQIGHKTNITEADYIKQISFNEDKTIELRLNTTQSSNMLLYNVSATRFNFYANTSSSMNNVYIYRKAGTFTIGEDGYATYYTENAYVMPEGVEGGIVTAATNDKLTIDYKYAAGSTVPAKSALLLKGAAKDYTYDVTTSEATADADNMLHGADAVDGEGKTFVEGTNVKYYILTHNAEKTDFGFYWAVADGAATEYQAPFAFLAVDAAKMSAPKMFSLGGDGNTTGITTIENTTVTDGRIYTVTGAYAGNDINRLPKGIYIMNGKKIAVIK